MSSAETRKHGTATTRRVLPELDEAPTYAAAMIGSRNVENVLRLRTRGAGKAQRMIVFEYTCSDCGPFQTVPIGDFSKAGIGKPPLRCPHCRGPVSIDIVTHRGPMPSDAA